MLGLVFLRNWYVRRSIHRLFPDRRVRLRMLDAGTGFGQWADYVARRYPNAVIHAVDIKEDYLEDARAYSGRAGYGDRVTFEKADLTRLIPGIPFDLILAVDVMEHIVEDERVFRNFFSLLRSGGHVIVNTPSDQGGSDVHGADEKSFIGEHVRDGYSAEEMADKLQRAGLDTVASTYSYGAAGSLGWRIMVKWPMVLLSRSFLFMVLLAPYYVAALPIGILLNAADVRLRKDTGTGLHVIARRPPDRQQIR